MVRSKQRGEVTGQELLSFDGPLTINTREYDPGEAREAAVHRHRRRGELALTPRTQGFRAGVSSLWVPHSGTENSAVVAIPENKVHQSKLLVRDKVFEKYEGSDVPFGRVALWAYFAGHQTEKDLRTKFDTFRLQSREGYLQIHDGLGPNGEIIREDIEENKFAYHSVRNYLINLQAFVGAPEVLNQAGRRMWPQPRHHRDYARRMDRAENYLAALPSHEFDQTVKEAYYSERSRHEFWTLIRDEHIEYEKLEHERWMVQYAKSVLPIEAYASDPRIDEANYVDGEYIFE